MNDGHCWEISDWRGNKLLIKCHMTFYSVLFMNLGKLRYQHPHTDYKVCSITNKVLILTWLFTNCSKCNSPLFLYFYDPVLH